MDTDRDFAPAGMKLDQARRVFRISEAYLDKADEGPRHFLDPTLAGIVHDSILDRALDCLDLFAHVVMPNHVHILMTPRGDLPSILGGMKRRTSRRINAALAAVGRPLWQDESFDHVVRSDDSFWRILDYIERNPVKAGLCADPGDWACSSAAMREHWRRGDPWRAPS